MGEEQLVKLCSLITKTVAHLGLEGTKDVIETWIMQDIDVNEKLQRFCHSYAEEATKPILELKQELNLVKRQLASLQHVHMKLHMKRREANHPQPFDDVTTEGEEDIVD